MYLVAQILLVMETMSNFFCNALTCSILEVIIIQNTHLPDWSIDDLKNYKL